MLLLPQSNEGQSGKEFGELKPWPVCVFVYYQWTMHVQSKFKLCLGDTFLQISACFFRQNMVLLLHLITQPEMVIILLCTQVLI